MKYNININQLAVYENFKDKLDIIDMSIYDYCRDFIMSENKTIRRVTIEGKVYVWINYDHLINQMPLLKIKSKDPIYKRLLKLVNSGLLEKQTFNNNMPVFKLGINSDKLIFKTDAPLQLMKGSIVKNEGGQLLAMDNNININNINNNILSEWNDFANTNNIPIIKTITNGRNKKYNTRVKEGMKLNEIFKKIECSDFLQGKNNNNWTISFDWLIENSQNWLKIIEGNYDSKENKSKPKAMSNEESERRARGY